MEHGKSLTDAKRKAQAKKKARLNSKAVKDGGLTRSSNEVSVMEMEQRG